MVLFSTDLGTRCHGIVRASLDADAIVALQVLEAQALRQSFIEEGYEAAVRTGDIDDPIAGILEVKDRHGNRVDLLIGLRGMDPNTASVSIDNGTDFIWSECRSGAGGPIITDAGSF